MSLEETKDALVKDSSFGYHGDRDVSLVPGTNKVLIETDSEYGHGSNFLKRCYFQFFEDKLFIITININQDKMDYYSIFTKLSEKYGKPDSLDPQSATWKNDDITLSLERPLTLKYIDNEKKFYEIWTSKESIVKSLGKGLFKKVNEIPALPINGIKIFDGITYSSKIIENDSYVISVTLKANEDFNIEFINEFKM